MDTVPGRSRPGTYHTYNPLLLSRISSLSDSGLVWRRAPEMPTNSAHHKSEGHNYINLVSGRATCLPSEMRRQSFDYNGSVKRKWPMHIVGYAGPANLCKISTNAVPISKWSGNGSHSLIRTGPVQGRGNWIEHGRPGARDQDHRGLVGRHSGADLHRSTPAPEFHT